MTSSNFAPESSRWRRQAQDALLREIESEIAATASRTGRKRLGERTYDALRRVPRHAFVEAHIEDLAYVNRPLPIGHGQTISQPFIVALMTDLLDLTPSARVLEIGTGCGYQAAVLSVLAREVYSVERVEALALGAAETLARLGFANVHIRTGDGSKGWPEHAPFDAIIVTACAAELPYALVDQLAPGARLVLPLGAQSQELTVVTRKVDGSVEIEPVLDVRFVPLRIGSP